jgi:hypothetical protein
MIFSSARISTEDMKNFTAAVSLGLLPKLEVLSLMHTRINKYGMRELTTVMDKMNNLKELCLSHNLIGNEGMEAFYDKLSKNKIANTNMLPNLDTLHLFNVGLDDEGKRKLKEKSKMFFIRFPRLDTMSYTHPLSNEIEMVEH